MIGWLLRRVRRRPEPKFNPYDYGYPLRNPVHEYMWPDCHLPLPHGHDLGVIASRDALPTATQTAETGDSRSP